MQPDSLRAKVVHDKEVADFSDRLGKPAALKELVLHVAELENELNRTGTLEITERTLGFIADRPVRSAVEKINTSL